MPIPKSGAANHRGSSKQDYETPWELVRAIEAYFDECDDGQGYEPFILDLAASRANKKAELWIGEDRDSLSVDWCSELGVGLPDLDPYGAGWGFLNPPFANIAPWAAKCAGESARGARIAFLVPASVGANWWRDHVHGKARVLFLNGRVPFDGVHGFPKDCAVCLYGLKPGYEVFDWRKYAAESKEQRSLFAGAG